MDVVMTSKQWHNVGTTS